MDEQEKNRNPHFWLIPYSAVLLLIAGLVGGIVSGVNQNLLYLEVILVLIGLFDLMFFSVRIFFRDRVNYRKNKSVFEDKSAPEYKSYIINQWILFGIGILFLLVSLLIFLIRR